MDLALNKQRKVEQKNKPKQTKLCTSSLCNNWQDYFPGRYYTVLSSSFTLCHIGLPFLLKTRQSLWIDNLVIVKKNVAPEIKTMKDLAQSAGAA